MPAASPSTSASVLVKAVFAGGAYLVAMLLSYHFGGGYVEEADIWLATGVSIAVLTLADPTHWSAYAAAIAIGSVLGNVYMGSSFGTAIVYAIDELVVAVPTAWLLHRLIGRDAMLDEPRKVIAFVAVGAFGSAVWSWVVAIASYAMLGLASPATAWRLWVVSTAVGTLVVAPLFFEWSRFRAKRSGGPTTMDLALGGSLFVLMVAATLLVFAGDTSERFSGSVGYALTYLPLPFLVLGGIVWGPRGTTLSTFVMAAIAVLCTSHGQGPFAGVDGFLGEAVVEVQGFVAAAALLTLMMTALVGNQRRALQEAARWRVRYETVIGASDQLLYELDPASGRLDWAGDAERLLGTDKADLETLAGYLERVHADDRERVRAAFASLADGVPAEPMPHRFVPASGAEVRVDGDASPIVDFDDSIHRIVGYLRAAPAARLRSAA